MKTPKLDKKNLCSNDKIPFFVDLEDHPLYMNDEDYSKQKIITKSIMDHVLFKTKELLIVLSLKHITTFWKLFNGQRL